MKQFPAVRELCLVFSPRESVAVWTHPYLPNSSAQLPYDDAGLLDSTGSHGNSSYGMRAKNRHKKEVKKTPSWIYLVLFYLHHYQANPLLVI